MCYDASMNLKDLLKLAGEQGKVVVVDENGEVKGVFLSFADYQSLSAGLLEQAAAIDPEQINREILEAQLRENMDLSNHSETVVPAIQMPEAISQLLQERAQTLFVSQPAPPTIAEIVYDVREESVDPSALGSLGPQVSVDAEEEIKPNFDDI